MSNHANTLSLPYACGATTFAAVWVRQPVAMAATTSDTSSRMSTHKPSPNHSSSGVHSQRADYTHSQDDDEAHAVYAVTLGPGHRRRAASAKLYVRSLDSLFGVWVRGRPRRRQRTQ